MWWLEWEEAKKAIELWLLIADSVKGIWIVALDLCAVDYFLCWMAWISFQFCLCESLRKLLLFLREAMYKKIKHVMCGGRIRLAMQLQGGAFICKVTEKELSGISVWIMLKVSE